MRDVDGGGGGGGGGGGDADGELVFKQFGPHNLHLTSTFQTHVFLAGICDMADIYGEVFTAPAPMPYLL